MEVLQLTSQGLTAKEVGRELCISANPVERHRAIIMAKLGVSNRTELVRYAVERGLDRPGRINQDTFRKVFVSC